MSDQTEDKPEEKPQPTGKRTTGKKKPDAGPPWWFGGGVKIIVLAVCVFIVIYVLTRPSIVFAPTPRIVVFFALSILPIIVLTENISARLKVSIGNGLVFHATGATAVVFFGLFCLVKLSRPDIQRAIYHVKERGVGDAVWISANSDSAEVRAAKRGGAPVMYVSKSTIILDFPEQVEQATLILRDQAGGKVCERAISYTEEQTTLTVPDDFHCEAK